jgi:hypothetical protein
MRRARHTIIGETWHDYLLRAVLVALMSAGVQYFGEDKRDTPEIVCGVVTSLFEFFKK